MRVVWILKNEFGEHITRDHVDAILKTLEELKDGDELIINFDGIISVDTVVARELARFMRIHEEIDFDIINAKETIMNLIEKELEVSENPRAEELCGRRPYGTALYQPWELGYACPICGADDERLHWSEYNFFIWCENCNLDIPSVLCVKYGRPRLDDEPLDPETRVKIQTEIFLDCIEDVMKQHSE